MKESENCPLCDSTTFLNDEKASYLLNVVAPFSVMRCSVCGIRWLDPRLSEEEYDQVYAGGYFGFDDESISGDIQQVLKDYPNPTKMWESVQDTRVRSFHNKLKRLKKLDPSAQTVLDIGAGTGAFVREARRAGFDATGLETSEAACREAHENFDTTLEHGRLSQFSPGKQFDILHLNHVFEHFISPHEAVDDLKRLLRPGGYIMIEVPNQFGNGILFLKKLLGLARQDPRSLHSIHHPFFYTPATLREILEKGGFSVIWLKSYFPERWAGGVGRKLLSAVDLISDLFFDAGRDFEIVARLP